MHRTVTHADRVAEAAPPTVRHEALLCACRLMGVTPSMTPMVLHNASL